MAAAAALSFMLAGAATIRSTYYALQYDYQDFWIAADGKYFRVVLTGNPLPGLVPGLGASGLLPVMQAAKPRPALTFTYDAPMTETRPDCRLVLVSNAANDLNGEGVCKGNMRFQPGAAGVVNLFALLPQRHGDVDDAGYDAGCDTERPSSLAAAPRTVHGGIQRFASPSSPQWRGGAALDPVFFDSP